MDHSAKDSVLTVEVRCGTETDEELTTVCVGARVGHTQQTLVRVRVPQLFVVEPVTINGLSTLTVAVSCVTALHHETLDDSVEFHIPIKQPHAATTVVSSADSSEIFASFGQVSEKFKNNS